MADNFHISLGFVLESEGGFVDHPDDPGGATNMGVTQGTYDHFRKYNDLEQCSVRYIEDCEVEAIYRDRYWSKVNADKLPSGVDFAVFDFAVNSGPDRAARYLQELFPALVVDGLVGKHTLREVHAAPVCATIGRLCASRMAFFRSLSHWDSFGNGWSRRILDLRTGVIARAVRMTEPSPRPWPERRPEQANQARLRQADIDTA